MTPLDIVGLIWVVLLFFLFIADDDWFIIFAGLFVGYSIVAVSGMYMGWFI